MAFSNGLDEFRRQWKKEIVQGRTSEETPLNIASTSTNVDGKNHPPKRQSEESGLGPQHKLWRGVCGTNEEGSSHSSSNLNLDDKTTKETCIPTTHTSKKKSKAHRFVDIFIADLNDIDPIPFFDIELPREVAIKIFKHLSARDLCRCSQVSKSWRSLAEDELLWSWICHTLGYEEQASTVEKEDWKVIVRTAVEMEQMLVYNWKNRVGGLEEMPYIPGGILTAVSSYQDWLVAGYTSQDVKLWDLSTDTSCILSPASKALELGNDGFFMWNYVTKLAVNASHTFALYNTGVLHIWENDSEHLNPVYSSEQFKGGARIRSSQTAPLLGVVHRHSIKLFTEKSKEDYINRRLKEAELGQRVESSAKEVELEDESLQQEKWKQIGDLKYQELLSHGEAAHIQIHDFLIARKKSASPLSNEVCDHIVITAVNDEVRIHNMSHDLSDPSHMTQLYHTAFSPVQLLDYRVSGGELALVVAKDPDMKYYIVTGGVPCEIQLYDVQANRNTAILGHISEKMQVLNIRDSPENELVAGGYGVVHIYDRRISQSVQSLRDQVLASLSQIQMDEWKVVTGNSSGYVCTWDRRMAAKCWEMHNRHPVAYVYFRKNLMVTANIPSDLSPCFEDPANPEYMLHKRYRGQLSVFDFSVTQQREQLPSICQSTFDEPERYNYNIRLAMPYDTL